MRLSRDFYLISAHKYAQRKFLIIFLELPISRSSLEGDRWYHEESLFVVLGFEPVLCWTFFWLLSECPLPPLSVLLVASAIIHKMTFRTWLLHKSGVSFEPHYLTRLPQNPYETASKTWCQHTRHPPGVKHNQRPD